MNSEVVRVTSIVYVPHCGKCGYHIPVRDEIGIKYRNIYVKRKGEYRVIATDIYPNKCPHCGVLFDSIEITPPDNICREMEVEE